ncbi:hypothetical protein [Streptomyces stelliscabiei]|uniref:Uncharacterized protein n=1 Tax=Streptomyces stelliscabiei TaxID=146820 RepID=A0A8I0TTG5_9ACTN|nr:hypothetical protein [Streptomyces stelliscabiei]MBE1598986.1 hypothetical protein [Streptomyces stelliscabiei]MBE1599729.1 hypothetical protein [Streptomyces stelliscabiei]MDX2519388.1 hypothetical protein [Streptomyces stelliscabiei]MDX2549683.1 hypothetical protein [Streptomyces stelliscabiei]MDX2616113.1 hypothetical protein [Streptomyces stelliscabiei]
MTTRMYAHASAAAAALLTAGALGTALHTWWLGLFGLFTAYLFGALSRRCYTQARREQAVQQRLERLNDETSPVELPPPCCSFWRHTDGEVHGPDCTRPTAARTTLTTAEEHAFAALSAAFHRPGGPA